MKKIYIIGEDEISQMMDCVHEITNMSKAVNRRMELDSDKGTVNYFIECLLKSNFTIERILESSKYKK